MKLFKINNLDKIYTLLIILFPIIYIYNSTISTLSVADILLFVLWPILLFDTISNGKKIRVNVAILFVTLALFLQVLLYFLIGIRNSDAVMSSLRVFFYYLTCIIFATNYFDLEFGIKCLKIMAFLAALFGLIQFICLNFFDVFLQGTIPGFQTQVDKYNQVMNSHSWTSYAYTRSRSFFSEPSHFGVYICFGLMVYLYDYRKKELPFIATIVIAILLSGSGMAMALLTIVGIMIFIKNSKSITSKKIMIFALLALLIIGSYPIYSKTNSFKIFYKRTFITKDSTNGRFGNFIETFKKPKSAGLILFGEGMYKIADVEGQDYITSIPRIYTYYGIIGFIVFTFFSIRLFMKLKGLRLYSWTILLCISFASEILFNSLVIIFLPFIMKESVLNEE